VEKEAAGRSDSWSDSRILASWRRSFSLVAWSRARAVGVGKAGVNGAWEEVVEEADEEVAVEGEVGEALRERDGVG
jgi:hypothetical protein